MNQTGNGGPSLMFHCVVDCHNFYYVNVNATIYEGCQLINFFQTWGNMAILLYFPMPLRLFSNMLAIGTYHKCGFLAGPHIKTQHVVQGQAGYVGNVFTEHQTIFFFNSFKRILLQLDIRFPRANDNNNLYIITNLRITMKTLIFFIGDYSC